jgi:tetratricopeptide (TPR) repeat protein
MLSDRYGNGLSTASAAARDAYVEGCDLMFASWPGAREAFGRATGEDPGFVLAHLGAAQAAAIQGDMAGIKTALGAAQGAADKGLTAREASQLGFLTLMLAGKAAEALAAARVHLGEWPRDAVVMNQYGPIVGLIGFSGRPGLKREQELVMDSFAPHYGEDWWFMAHHAMAISEMGRRDEALALTERSLALNPRNAWAAHSRGHVAYEAGEADGARAFLAAWIKDYPREGGLHGHLAWHLALATLNAGEAEEAGRLFDAMVAPGSHLGHPRTQVVDAAQFLWRWEMAGHQRDASRWLALDALAHALLPRAAAHFSDWHVTLADAAAGDVAALEARVAEMEALVRAGRYPEGGIVPEVARGFAAYARGDYDAAIAVLSPVVAESERLGGSRAQLDLLEFTVLRACVEAGRMDEVARRMAARRTGPAGVNVAGVH